MEIGAFILGALIGALCGAFLNDGGGLAVYCDCLDAIKHHSGAPPKWQRAQVIARKVQE